MTMLARFSIRGAMLGVMALLGVVTVAVMALLVITTSSMRQEIARQNEQMAQDEQIAARIVDHARLQVDAAHDHALHGHPESVERFRAEGMAVYDNIRLYLFRDLDRDERLLVERIREQHQNIEVAAQRVFTGATPDAAADLAGTLVLGDQLTALLELRRRQSGELLAQHDRAWWWLSAALAATGMLFLGMIAAATLFLRRRLVEPLEVLSAAAGRVGGGDFGVRIEERSVGELATVADSFNRMAERLELARVRATNAEHRFQDLVEGLSTVVWEAEADTLRCTYVSPQAERLLGHPVHEWIGTGIWRRVIHPEDYDRVMAECGAATAAAHDHELEYRAVHADGSVLWVRDFVRVLVDDAGVASRLRGVFTDITAGRAAADALRESEARYHSLFDRVPVGLYRTTPSGRFIDVNPAMVRLLGYSSRAELLSANAADFYPDPAHRTAWQERVHAATGFVEADLQQRRRDGTVIQVRDTGRVVRADDGSVTYYEGALQDVTARMRAAESVRRSEARFRSLIENASDGVLVLSRRGKIRYQSPAVSRILGYPPAELQGRSLLPLVHADDQERVRAAFGALDAGAGEGRSIEFRCSHRDGSWRVLHAIGSNLLDDAIVSGYVVNMIDATVHRRLEEKLGQAQKMEAVGRLAGGIAHDFNNLLTAIRGYTELLSEKLPADDRAQGDLSEIRRAAESAATLTRQLLAFGRRQVVRLQPTDVASVVRELEQMLRRLITEDIPLHTSVADDCWVRADPGQLEQVVVNLVVNARDAGPSAGISLTVECTAADGGDGTPLAGLRAGEYVMITVQDDGCGIEPEHLPLLFEPFFTTKDVGRGTGLGLATVYGIVEQSGGRVVIESQPLAGTRVRVYLPRVAAEATVEAPPAVQPAAGGSELVMLVEDEASVRSLGSLILRRQGYSVVTAVNGRDALEIAATLPAPIDLLITDVVMPEMGGVRLAAAYARRQPGLKVLFISGYAAEELSGWQDRAPTHFLEKPFAPASFAAAVRNAIDDAAAAYAGPASG